MPLTDLIKKKLVGQTTSTSTPKKFPSQKKSLESVSTPVRKRSVPIKEFEAELFCDGSIPTSEVDLGLASNVALTLADVLDKPSNGAIGYFGQYLEARDASNLIKFWLDVEGFKASISSCTNCTTCDPRDLSDPFSSTPHSPISTEVDDDDDLEVNLPQNNHSDSRKPCGSTESFDSGCFQHHSQMSEPNSVTKDDALEIYQRFIAPDCPYPLPLDTENANDVVQGICTESGLPDPTCFDSAQTKIVQLLDEDYFPDFLRSEGHAEHLVDVLTGEGVCMGDILHYDELLFHFREFMEGEGDRDLLEFWMAASNFRKQTLKREAEQKQIKEDALVIYQRFVSMQANSPLGVSDRMRSSIEEAICTESGVVDPSCFDPLLSLVVRVLQDKYLAAFLRSTLYKKFLSELFCRIQTSPYPKQNSQQKRRRSFFSNRMKRSGSNSSLSTCSSSDVTGLSSISSQNTLLAGGKVNGKVSNRDSEIDLFDPDSIWRRKQNTVVNIGRIDSLGRYTSSVEKLPAMTSSVSADSLKSSSKLTRAVKRLVSNEVDQAQEDMAWQMAEMIVSDVMEVNACQRISEEEEEEKS